MFMHLLRVKSFAQSHLAYATPQVSRIIQGQPLSPRVPIVSLSHGLIKRTRTTPNKLVSRCLPYFHGQVQDQEQAPQTKLGQHA